MDTAPHSVLIPDMVRTPVRVPHPWGISAFTVQLHLTVHVNMVVTIHCILEPGGDDGDPMKIVPAFINLMRRLRRSQFEESQGPPSETTRYHGGPDPALLKARIYL